MLFLWFHISMGPALPTALILKVGRVWEVMDLGEKILLTKGIVLDSKLHE